MKKIFFTVCTTLLTLTLCACSFQFSTANFQNLKMASAIDEASFRPVNVTDTFAPDSPIIYLTGTLKNATDGTAIKAEWTYLDADSELVIDSAVLAIEDTNTDFQFNLSVPDNGWPIGEYEVRLYIDDVLKTSVAFSVNNASEESTKTTAPSTKEDPTTTPSVTTTQPQQSQTNALKLTNLKTASAIDTVTFKPITVSDVFSTSSPIIYVTGSIAGAPIGTILKSEWVYLETDPDFLIDTATVTTEIADTNFQFNLSIPNNGWPIGNYEVRLYIDNAFSSSVPFRVE